MEQYRTSSYSILTLSQGHAKGERGYLPFTQTGIHRCNLVTVKKTQYHDPKTILTTCNVQSIKTKELQVSELLTDHAIDILILTEIWLSNKDKNWIEASDLNRHNYDMYTSHRQNRRRGGLGLICKSHYKVKTVQTDQTRLFEYATWMITVKNRHINVTCIYHPLYSTENRITNKMFTDYFTSFSSDLFMDHTNNVILGDFNLHVSNDDNTEAAIFTDTCEVFGLYQHVTFPMHNSGNIPDLVLTEAGGNTTVLRSHQGPYITDHTAVITQLNINRCDPSRQTRLV